jgi:hypothetical protein
MRMVMVTMSQVNHESTIKENIKHCQKEICANEFAARIKEA